MVKLIFSIIRKKFCRVFCTSKLFTVYFVTFFLHKVSHKCNSWQVVCFFSSLLRHFLVDTHYQEWSFICSYGYTRSGHLFYQSRLLEEFSEISFTFIHVSYLGNIFVLSTVSPGLTLIWLQKNAPDNVKFGS